MLWTQENLDALPKSRKEALAIGAKYYFLNKVCPHGHNDRRTADNGTCVPCIRIRTAPHEKTEKRKEQKRKYGKRYRASGKGKASAKKYAQSEKGKAKKRAYNATTKGKECNRNSELKKNFGITISEFKELICLQHNKCAICNTEFEEGKNAHMDHCHESGKNRGILCFTCNAALGMFKDNPKTLQSAIRYLRRHSI